MTTGKTIALTRWAFVGKVMSLLLNMLSRHGKIKKQKRLEDRQKDKLKERQKEKTKTEEREKESRERETETEAHKAVCTMWWSLFRYKCIE